MPEPIEVEARSSRGPWPVRLGSAALIAIGTTVLLGWALDVAALKCVVPGLITMRANTALGLLLAGAALGMLRQDPRRNRLAAALAASVAAIGGLTLLEHIAGVDLGIDQALFRAPPEPASPVHPGRMMPTTALDFALLGVATILIAADRWHRAAHALALLAGLVAGSALVGYAYGVRVFLWMAAYNQMALHTAAGLLAFSAAVLMARPGHGLMGAIAGQTAGGLMARRLLPVAVLVPFTLDGLALLAESAGVFDQRFATATRVVATIAIFVGCIGWNAHTLHRLDGQRRRSDRSLRLMADAMPQLAWMARPDGHISWYNRRWYDYTGTTAGPMEGWGWRSTVDPVVLPEVVARWRLSIADGSPFEMVFPIRGADGRFREFLTRVEPSRDAEGRVLSWFGTNTDIDEQKRAEEGLRRSEGRARQLADSMPLIVWAARPDGRVDYYNERWYEFTGRPRGAEGDEGWAPAVHPDDLRGCTDAWDQAVETGEPFRAEHRLRHHATGEYRWHVGRASPARDASGRVTRWFGTAVDVHDERLGANTLREAEARQRRAMSAARLAHWEWDLVSDRIVYQDSPGRLFHRPDDRPFADLADCLAVIPAEDHAVIRAAADRAMVPGVPYEGDQRVIWPDGSTHWVSCQGGAVFGEDGTPVRMVGVDQDITERKEAEAEILRLNEGLERRVVERTAELARQVRLIDRAHDAILVRSEGDVISSWNQGAERTYGWTASEAVGRVSHELLGTRFPGPRSEIEGELARLGSWDGELVHRRKDGARIVVASRWVADRDASAGGAILEINSDITERRASEEALRRSEAALKESQRLAGVGSWEWEPVADSVTWSPELYRMAGRDPDGPAARHAESAELFTPEGLALQEAAVAAALRDGEPYEIELEMIGGDGVRRWITARGEAVRGADRRVVGLRGTAQDITARRRSEEELRRARDEAMAANRAKSAFLANMSHEIRTPMNGVLGMTELALATDLTPRQREYLGLARSSAEALLVVIGDILDFSKIEAGKLTLDPTPFHLRDAVTDTLRALATRAHEKGLELACRFAPDVPGSVVGDAGRLRQVLVNLVGNAIKFTEHGEVVLAVEAGADGDPPDRLRFSVSDTGIGIPAGKRAAIFDAFEQADGSTTREYGGTGLGLTICSRLIELMQGRIWVEENSGGGSVFRFTARLDPDPDPEAEPDPADPGRLAGLRVLIVDDNRANRLILEELLARWGCRPTSAAGGAEALAALAGAIAAGEPFGLILLDRMMPGMDGIEMAGRIRRDPALDGVRMVMLTSGGDDESGRSGELGIGGWLSKPLRHSELFDALLDVLGHVETSRPVAGPGPIEAGPGPTVRRLRVLLAEDHPINQKVATRMLEDQGHEVAVVGDGRAAVEASGAGEFDLILMDVQMPLMDGFEATAAIRLRERGSGRHVPIVALTAHAMAGDRERCLGSGFDDYLFKPIRSATLRAALGRLDGPGAAPHVASPGGISADLPAFDRVAALVNLGGDEDLLDEVVGLFLDDGPRLLASIRAAIVAGDGAALGGAAHTVSGVAGHFAAGEIVAPARRLQVMARSGDLSGAVVAEVELGRAFDRFRIAALARRVGGT